MKKIEKEEVGHSVTEIEMELLAKHTHTIMAIHVGRVGL